MPLQMITAFAWTCVNVLRWTDLPRYLWFLTRRVWLLESDDNDDATNPYDDSTDEESPDTEDEIQR